MLAALPGRPEWQRGYCFAIERGLRSAQAVGEDPGKVAARCLARLDAEEEQ
jgi:hypothetical protein